MVSVINIYAQIDGTFGYKHISGQSDGFFKYDDEFRKINNDEYELILLPKTHGLDYNYPAENVSIGQGLLLMSALGVLYVIKKRQY